MYRLYLEKTIQTGIEPVKISLKGKYLTIVITWDSTDSLKISVIFVIVTGMPLKVKM